MVLSDRKIFYKIQLFNLIYLLGPVFLFLGLISGLGEGATIPLGLPIGL